MPAISRTTRNPFVAKAQRNGNSAQGAPTADVSPQEAAAIRSSVGGKDQSPSQEQLAAYVNWRAIADTLGDPYQTEHIPISKLKMMRRDPTIGFGLSFIKTPHVRARWYIDAKDSNGPNAQVAAHLDHDLRLIMSSFVLQWCNSLDFGFQGAAKRFEFGVPAGTYVAQGTDGSLTQQPIWNQGNIQPIRWKPFVALPPETVEPNWASDGSFNGINFDTSGGSTAPAGAGAKPSGGGEDSFDIDLYHSLWITNERDTNFGSVYGYPRLGYCNTGEAPILMGDYSLKEISEVKVGDEIIGWEQKHGRRASGVYTPRSSLCRSTVTEIGSRITEVVKVTFESGKVIRCTPDHLWLHHHSNRATPVENNPWTTAIEGRTLSNVLDVDSSTSDIPLRYEDLSEDQKIASNWLGGIYDGEGSGAYIAQSSIHNPDVCERIADSLDILGFDYRFNDESCWIKGGRVELMRFARLTRITRMRAMDRVILGHRFQIPDKIISVEPDGKAEVFSLTTTTGNYIAWGFASKNCYRYWWSYWFRWAIADRAFEKKADPSILIWHPQGEFIDPTTGQQTAYADYALNMGYRMRSGGVITLPSTPYEGANGPINLREWDIDFTKDMVNFDPFDKSFDYLDIGKIRSLWIPEQALVEGRGGTSSRNVAAELDSSFTESQAVMSIQISETVNRWIIPQWLAVNYPEFLANNGTAQIVIQGFADEDIAFTQQILQLIGQQPSGINTFLTMVDLQKILDDAGVPLLDIQQQQQQLQKVIQLEQASSSPNPVQPNGGPNGNVGVLPATSIPVGSGGGSSDPTGTGGDPGTTTQTGFAHRYIQPREVIYLTRKDVYGDEEEQLIQIKRVPDSDDGIIARFDSNEQTIFLSESASVEDSQKYIAKVGQALARD